jgi:DNA-binding NarL/FixJ family response regulator
MHRTNWGGGALDHSSGEDQVSKGSMDTVDHDVIRVLVCENDPVMRSALGDLINSIPGLELTGVAAGADEAGAEAARVQPDVALLDVRMPGGGGPEAARQIRERCPTTRLIAFSAHADRAVVIKMLLAGVCEYLIKGADDEELAEAIRRTGRGHLALSQAELTELVFDLVDLLAETHQRVEAR